MRTKKRNINRKKMTRMLLIYNNLSTNSKKIFGSDILNLIKRRCKKKKLSYNKLRQSLWKRRKSQKKRKR